MKYLISIILIILILGSCSKEENETFKAEIQIDSSLIVGVSSVQFQSTITNISQGINADILGIYIFNEYMECIDTIIDVNSNVEPITRIHEIKGLTKNTKYYVQVYLEKKLTKILSEIVEFQTFLFDIHGLIHQNSYLNIKYNGVRTEELIFIIGEGFNDFKEDYDILISDQVNLVHVIDQMDDTLIISIKKEANNVFTFSNSFENCSIKIEDNGRVLGNTLSINLFLDKPLITHISIDSPNEGIYWLTINGNFGFSRIAEPGETRPENRVESIFIGDTECYIFTYVILSNEYYYHNIWDLTCNIPSGLESGAYDITVQLNGYSYTYKNYLIEL